MLSSVDSTEINEAAIEAIKIIEFTKMLSSVDSTEIIGFYFVKQ